MLSNILLFSVVLAAALIGCQSTRHSIQLSNVEFDENGVSAGGGAFPVTAIHLQESSSGKRYRMDCMVRLMLRGADFMAPAEIQGAVGVHMKLKVAS